MKPNNDILDPVGPQPEKKKANWWLVDEEFLKKSGFEDLYYLQRLGVHLYEFFKNVPIPVLSTYDKNHHRIYLTVGTEQNWFRVSNEISFYDFIKQMKRWLIQYYPQYEVEVEEDEDLSEEEVLQKVKEGIDLNELAHMKKKVIKKEKGVITKIILSKDSFEFIKNGVKTIRMSGSIHHILPLSYFLKNIREMRKNNVSDKEIREYIFQNSDETERIPESTKKILINHPSKMMKNFFVINFPDLKNEPIKKKKKISSDDEPDRYIWGPYEIEFDNDSVREDCFQYVSDRRKEKNIQIDISNV